MENPEKPFAELVNIVKSWIPRRSETSNVSRDFWMPDNSCRVCYDCDSQFTLFNRRHHCRLCGRIFCGKCTSNSIPLLCYYNKGSREEGERLRVCNYCFKQWEQGTELEDNRSQACISPSLSTTSLISTKSTATNSVISNAGSFTAGPYQHVLYSSNSTLEQSAQIDPCRDKQDTHASTRNVDSVSNFRYGTSRSYDKDDEYRICHGSETQCCQHSDIYYGPVEFEEVDQDYHSTELHLAEERVDSKEAYSLVHDNMDLRPSLGSDKLDEEADNSYECDASSALYHIENADAEPLDFESNGLIWLPPEPEDEEDEVEAIVDDEDVDATGEWDYDRSSSSFGSGEYRSRDRSNEEHKKAMKDVVDGHFRSLIAQLLQVENVPVGEEGDQESWLEIVTSLSCEAATLLKPDTSKGGGMDPGGYVKVKCLPCCHRSESNVVKGIVCKKNVSHRRMASRIEKPRILILGGALEYQRVTNLLSSFDTLLQQEMDHLKMAVAKIAAHKPNVLLVEKSVSRFAQEYLLAKGISLVLNIKRPLLERISRCTGAQIIPSIDHLSPPMLGRCDLFYVEKFVEDYAPTGQVGKKLMKTLMFFEGCPRPLGCTVLLKGANLDELKKVKHVVQYGVFAAYHLAMETSFLADEGASLPELSLRSPNTVALPDKPPSLGRSISVIPGFTVPASDNSTVPSSDERMNDSNPVFSSIVSGESVMEASALPENHSSDIVHRLSTNGTKPCTKVSHKACSDHVDHVLVASNRVSLPFSAHGTFSSTLPLSRTIKEKNKVSFEEIHQTASSKHDNSVSDDSLISFTPYDDLDTSETKSCLVSEIKNNNMVEKQLPDCDQETSCQNVDDGEDQIQVKEEFPPTSDHQSILVSVSTRCVWKGTVCERSQLFRIKYYGNFDKPLGRFLRDHLFDQSYKCHSCDSPTEAHVHSYTHRQGSITITVTNIPEPLPGERDGKIWMWHRCLKCPRSNGLPPATRRIVMSDAAWGLSFGKFLELSFSNHAAASRVASCGHSLHKDCLRFYGCGKMVACFRYTAINVNSVYLPPSIVEFDYQHQDWIQKEANEVAERGKLFFSEIQNFICLFLEKTQNNGVEELRDHLVELEELLQKEKTEFENALHKAIHGEARKGQPIIDLLEVNRLRHQIVFLLSLCYHRLALLAESDLRLKEVLNSYLTKDKEKLYSIDKIKDSNATLKPQKDFLSSNGTLDPKGDEPLKGDANIANYLEGLTTDHDHIPQPSDIETDIFPEKQSKTSLYTSTSATEQSISLECGLVGRRTLSDGQVPVLTNLPETFDAKWTGENATALPDFNMLDPLVSPDTSAPVPFSSDIEQQTGADAAQSFASLLISKLGDGAEDITNRLGIPFLNIYRSINRNWGSTPRFNDSIDCYSAFTFLLQELEHHNAARFLRIGVNNIVIPIYDDEPTSVISFALVSHEYHNQLSDERERVRDGWDSSQSPFLEAGNCSMFQSSDEIFSDHFRSFGSTDESSLSLSGSRSSLGMDQQSSSKAMHARISFTDEGTLGKVKYSVTCYYAKPFDDLRRACCPNEADFIRSLSRCKKWGAQGGKSNVFFAKTLDDRFIVKQVTKTELESFIKFAPQYFKYLSESIATGSPTCLAKILGIYQVSSKNLKGGKESRMDVLVMENLLFRKNVTRLYDLKGSSRSRYNPDSSGNNKVLLDQNLIEAMPTSPIFVGNKAKRLLERAVWNDTSFLASIDVMDYSLLAGIDEEKNELVLGIIDFMRQYTWDKHLETWVKVLGGPKNVSPTVISPKQYKKRFRKAMSAYFLVVPDQWSPPATIPSKLSTDTPEDYQKDTSVKE